MARSFQDRVCGLVRSALPSCAPCSWTPELNRRVAETALTALAVEFGNPGAAVVAAGTTAHRGSQPTYAILKRPCFWNAEPAECWLGTSPGDRSLGGYAGAEAVGDVEVVHLVHPAMQIDAVLDLALVASAPSGGPRS